MIFTATALEGVWIVDLDRREDERGYFARSYDAAEFAAHGLQPCDRQWSVSFNRLAGTLRGLHWQADPHQEAKLVRCTRGRVFDVAVDLRATSPTRGQHVAVELSATTGRALYIPPGCAHGFQTLEADSELLYGISPEYVGGAARGVRFDDRRLAIPWPLPPVALSPRDLDLPEWQP